MFLPSVKAWRAPGRSPWAARTSPSLFQLTERSRCHSALPGSAAARLVADVLACGEGLEGAGEVALGRAHVAELVPADGEVALPLGVAGVGGGEPVGDVLAFGEGLEGAGQVALGRAHVAELVPADGEVALPLGVAGVGGGELVGDVLAFGEGLEGAGRSPWAARTSPSLFQLTERSRCHSALPGSAAAEAAKQSLAVS